MPKAVDLFCGLGGWTKGLLAEEWDVRGYDIEAHEYDDERYPADLIVRNVLDMHGSEIADADLIVSSSPCQDFSYRAMPWTRARNLTGPFLGILLFHEQFRLQREASEAAGRYIPMVVENVRGAQAWIGKAAANYGSYYFWGDVPPRMPKAAREGRKNPGFRFDGSGKSFQSESVNRHVQPREGVKNRDADGYERDHPNAFGRKAPRTSSTNVGARKAASARIAQIPFAVSSYVGAYYSLLA